MSNETATNPVSWAPEYLAHSGWTRSAERFEDEGDALARARMTCGRRAESCIYRAVPTQDAVNSEFVAVVDAPRRVRRANPARKGGAS